MKLTFISLLTIFLSTINSNAQTTDLQILINNAKDGDTIFLDDGVYSVIPSDYIENECGNCRKHETIVYGTKGFLVENKSLHIIGTSPEKVVIITNAGYGLLFLNSKNSTISNVTITGGVRDTSGDATNGGIVLKYSHVLIENCVISNDTVRFANDPVVGICGIVIREGSFALIRNNIIVRNTWDGIALYRGANAVIEDNIIQTGRGAGIGVTWNANALIVRNKVSGFWKGIGTFGNSKAEVYNNAVFDNLGWGIVISGNSEMQLINNVITRNGNCGVAPWTSDSAHVKAVIVNNIITLNGWRDEWVCPQVGYWMNAPGSDITFKYNNVWGIITVNTEIPIT